MLLLLLTLLVFPIPLLVLVFVLLCLWLIVLTKVRGSIANKGRTTKVATGIASTSTSSSTRFHIILEAHRFGEHHIFALEIF
uniref:Putative secreted protein n=1 Tax=Anopheles darlingi TaxID=43151 RepID=A0A2M4D6R7_ANODA